MSVKDQKRIPISNKPFWKENLTLCILSRGNQRGTKQNLMSESWANYNLIL